mmetsp:Transcript_35397/g.77467  ORF Transcript_35397/g.77467 Transcript_35397/m.77467 type:complete len:231 (+) Transcript_35397:56-748(+)
MGADCSICLADKCMSDKDALDLGSHAEYHLSETLGTTGGGTMVLTTDTKQAGQTKLGQQRVLEDKKHDPLANWRGTWIDTSQADQYQCINEGKIFWSAETGHEPSELRVGPMPNQAILVLDGDETTATFEMGPPAVLRWSDSAVWVRNELQGTWVQEPSRNPVGEIRDNYFHWGGSFQHAPTELQGLPALPNGKVTMNLDGETTWAVFKPGPPSRLQWCDGEVWVCTTGQ